MYEKYKQYQMLNDYVLYFYIFGILLNKYMYNHILILLLTDPNPNWKFYIAHNKLIIPLPQKLSGANPYPSHVYKYFVDRLSWFLSRMILFKVSYKVSGTIVPIWTFLFYFYFSSSSDEEFSYIYSSSSLTTRSEL